MKLLMVMTLLVGNVFAADKMVNVVIKTNQGDIQLELNQTKAPITVKNFLSYIDKKFYDGLIFHRVIKQFMIQGGGFDKKMVQKKPGLPIKNEAKNGLKNDIGTIAMARTNIVDSATSQFFINTKDNSFLNHQGEANYGYAVFGTVTKGMSVIKKIETMKTATTNGHQNVPVDPIVIKTIVKL